MITNPILPGFNPDPSICRVGDDYYIATSTFEWYPGVQIYHSTNLNDWELITRPLRRASQLDMRGNPDSGGIWAPCLSHADGLFWLIYTDVKRKDGNFKDGHNYLVTAPELRGDWSDPIHVNSSGFDPSLFHDTDGRKWFLNLSWNHQGERLGQARKRSAFDGILLQEYSHESGCLIGDVKNIFKGTERGLTEGPHVFKRGEYYYLVTAEGGTGYGHAVTHARSKSLAGPYELHPDKYLMHAVYTDDGSLQRTGHGQTVETPSGDWYHTHLCSRPLPGVKRSPLGRETGIQHCSWGEDGWLRMSHGGLQAAGEVPAPKGVEMSARKLPKLQRYEFDTIELPIDFQWLRTPEPERLFSLTARPGHLRLYGRESIGSYFEQSLVARRLQHHQVSLTTELTFDPESYQHSAGLTAYYNRHKYAYLQMTYDDELGHELSVIACLGDWQEERFSFYSEPVALEQTANGQATTVQLRCVIDNQSLRFFWRQGGSWQAIGETLDASVLSDEGGRGEHASFTGCFVGMMAFDTSGHGKIADFSFFEYQQQ